MAARTGGNHLCCLLQLQTLPDKTDPNFFLNIFLWVLLWLVVDVQTDRESLMCHACKQHTHCSVLCYVFGSA